MKINKMAFVAMMMTAAVVLMGCQPVVVPDPIPEPEIYTVTYNTNGFSDIAPVDANVYLTDDVVTVEPAMDGTDGWSLSPNGATVSSFTMGSSNVVLYAQWKKVDATIIFRNTEDNVETTKVYQKNGIGTYYTVTDDVAVLSDISASIGSVDFVNDTYYHSDLNSADYLVQYVSDECPVPISGFWGSSWAGVVGGYPTETDWSDAFWIVKDGSTIKMKHCYYDTNHWNVSTYSFDKTRIDGRIWND